jgi:hypothetical protein
MEQLLDIILVLTILVGVLNLSALVDLLSRRHG